MIKLSSQKYKLVGITKDDFWKKLNSITVGQNINPEISYSTQFDGNYSNKFGGRKKGNNFSIYLYRPITRGFRTEILAKGNVVEDSSKNAINIYVNFEIPLWSIFMFLILSPLLLLPFYFLFETFGYIVILFGLGIYALILRSNHEDIVKELEEQLKEFSKSKNN